jgi:hypothetical protein
METKLEGNFLVIRLPLQQARPSKTGKTLVIASTGAPVKTGAEHKGKTITVNVSAWIPTE